MITYSAEGVKMPKIKKREISRWIKAVAATHGRKVGEIGIAKPTIRRNAMYFYPIYLLIIKANS